MLLFANACMSLDVWKKTFLGVCWGILWRFFVLQGFSVLRALSRSYRHHRGSHWSGCSVSCLTDRTVGKACFLSAVLRRCSHNCPPSVTTPGRYIQRCGGRSTTSSTFCWKSYCYKLSIWHKFQTLDKMSWQFTSKYTFLYLLPLLPSGPPSLALRYTVLATMFSSSISSRM